MPPQLAFQFLIQKDSDISSAEARAVGYASMITDGWQIQRTWLESILSGTHLCDPAFTPVGSVEFVQAVAARCGIVLPPSMSYPECLRSEYYLKRNVWQTTLKNKMSGELDGFFIKPMVGVKTFTGGINPDIQGLDSAMPIWASEPVRFLSEWRYYIRDGVVIGHARYDDGPDDAPEPDGRLVVRAMKLMLQNKCPIAYTLDCGVMANGDTALIEANDAWAIGFYRGTLSTVEFALMLRARWMQLAGLFNA